MLTAQAVESSFGLNAVLHAIEEYIGDSQEGELRLRNFQT